MMSYSEESAEIKLLLIQSYMNTRGCDLEELLRVTFWKRFVKYKNCDQLDILELLEMMVRLEYHHELSSIINYLTQ